mmetsp:Transcript_11316/g.12631  ORF Transcript_11316/g.12631 Transcript_11316/m.12631 type:complete len:444 (+) Transcript_11316:94-1425(+)
MTTLDHVRNKPSKSELAAQFSPELLAMYYSRLFPFDLIHEWLSYNPKNEKTTRRLFSKREFSFTIDLDGEDIYIRYQSFLKLEEFRTAILQRKPRKIDIGAIFSHAPKDKNSIAQGFKTEQRELVFDIDLTDYDEVRHCGCSGADICNRCWQMMTMAIKVMDQGLRDDFGFQHIAWFYSGRRGVHAWVCDEAARMLSNEGRGAVANYFEVSLGNDNKKNEPSLSTPLHPMVKRAMKILEPMFIEHVLPDSGHGILATKEKWLTILGTLPECAERVRENLEKKWEKAKSSPSEKWEELKKHISIFLDQQKGANKAQKRFSTSERNCLETWPVETVLRYTYPRLDINVSKMQNHLLKSPFSVHPKTGRVCVPIDVNNVESFDPFQVPTLPQLMDELDEYESKGCDDAPSAEWEKTSLKSIYQSFKTEFLEPMWRERKTLLEEQTN